MKSTTRFSKNKRGLECLNCGQPLHEGDNFCSHCSQVNDERRISIKDYFSGFFSNFFSFDSRFYKTIVPLLFKPGKVSKEYIEGKRKKYTNPFQLYLHTTIIFFLLSGLINSVQEYTDIDLKGSTVQIKQDSIRQSNPLIDVANYEVATFDSIFRQRLDSIAKHTDYFKRIKSETISVEEKDTLFKILYDEGMKIGFPEDYTKNNTLTLKTDDVIIMNHIHNTATFLQQYFTSQHIEYAIHKKYYLSLSDQTTYNLFEFLGFENSKEFFLYATVNKRVPAIDALDSLGFEKTKINIYKYKKMHEFEVPWKAEKTMKSYGNAIVSKISIALFFLLPFFTLFFSLIYIRHRYQYSEHLVFVFNLQTVFFILLFIQVLFSAFIFSGYVFLILVLYFLFYFYKSLRNFYEQSHVKTALKFIMLNIIYVALAIIALIVVVVLAMFM